MSEEDLSRKVRLLTLSALCAANSELTYSQIASTLLVDKADIELWVIDGKLFHLVDDLIFTIHVFP